MPGALRGFHPAGNPRTDWCKVPPAVPLSPAVSFCSRVSGRMKPPVGPGSSGIVSTNPTLDPTTNQSNLEVLFNLVASRSSYACTAALSVYDVCAETLLRSS